MIRETLIDSLLSRPLLEKSWGNGFELNPDNPLRDAAHFPLFKRRESSFATWRGANELSRLKRYPHTLVISRWEKGLNQRLLKFFSLFLLLALAACGSTPAPRQPQAMEQALALDRDARRALKMGDLLRANYVFSKELALQQSVDDTAGVAMTLINLATLAHQLRDDKAGLNWLDKILLEKDKLYPNDAILIAAFRKAVMLTNMSRLVEAAAALQIADKRCESGCVLRYGIEVLKARIQLLQGDAQGALAAAQTLVKQVDADKEEQTNALRVLAGAEEKLMQYAAALQHYQQALAADKSLALSTRIGEDLSGMARVAKQLGRDDDAAMFARRALLVNESL